MANPAKKPPEPVRADRAYSSDQLCMAAGISPIVLRNAVKDGLKFVKIGRSRHFTGTAWIEFLRSKEAAPGETGTSTTNPDHKGLQ